VLIERRGELGMERYCLVCLRAHRQAQDAAGDLPVSRGVVGNALFFPGGPLYYGDVMFTRDVIALKSSWG
jgi:hypothetical protein